MARSLLGMCGPSTPPTAFVSASSNEVRRADLWKRPTADARSRWTSGITHESTLIGFTPAPFQVFDRCFCDLQRDGIRFDICLKCSPALGGVGNFAVLDTSTVELTILLGCMIDLQTCQPLLSSQPSVHLGGNAQTPSFSERCTSLFSRRDLAGVGNKLCCTVVPNATVG